MRKYFLTILMLIMANAFLHAQITIQPNVPAVGIIQKNQLWNVLIVNSSSNSYYECRLSLLLRDRVTGQEILTATTASFTIDAGAKQLNINTLNPIQYNYLSGTANNNLQRLIATGSYIACYSLTSKILNIAEDCIPFDTEPLSPPMLIFPADSSVLDIAPTQFSWTAPTPAGMFDRLHYEVLITEIQEGQKANEAIQQNLPFYNEGNVFSNSLNYPPSAPAFEKNKWYAWQVIARDDKAYAGKSEVWVFKVEEKTNTKIQLGSSFFKMKISNNELAVAQDGLLKVLYINEIADEKAIIKIVDLTNTQSDKKAVSFEVKLIIGDNYIERNLQGKLKLEEKKVYMAELTNSRGEVFTIRFVVKNAAKK